MCGGAAEWRMVARRLHYSFCRRLGSSAGGGSDGIPDAEICSSRKQVNKVFWMMLAFQSFELSFGQIET